MMIRVDVKAMRSANSYVGYAKKQNYAEFRGP